MKELLKRNMNKAYTRKEVSTYLRLAAECIQHATWGRFDLRDIMRKNTHHDELVHDVCVKMDRFMQVYEYQLHADDMYFI